MSAAAREAGGQGFVTEVGAPASRVQGQGLVVEGRPALDFATLSHQRYADGIDAIFAASDDYHDWDGWKDAVERATTLPAGARFEDFGRHPAPYRGVARVDTTRFFQLLDEEVVRPVADAAAMLHKAPVPHASLRRHDAPRRRWRSAPAFDYLTQISRSSATSTSLAAPVAHADAAE